MYWQWMVNTALYAGVGALLSTARLGAHRLRPGEVPLPRPRDRSSTCCSPACWCPRSMLADPAVPAAGEGRTSRTPTGRCCCPASSPRTASTWPGSTPPPPCPATLIEAARIDGAERVADLPPDRPADDGARAWSRSSCSSSWRSGTTSCCRSSCSATTRSSRSRSASTRCSNRAPTHPALYTLVITGALLVDHPADRAVPGHAAYWRLDLLSGAVKADDDRAGRTRP